MAPALRFQANLPFKFWGDFVLTVYLINKIPSPILGNPTPSERLLHKPLMNYIYEYFVIFAMPRPYLGMGINLMQDLDPASSLITLLGLKATNCLISVLVMFTSIEFLFLISKLTLQLKTIIH